jgi:MFS superfamily sulfate permease-like transporter
MGGLDSLPLLSVVTGVMVAMVFALNLDRYIMFIPSAVVHGFTCGVCRKLLVCCLNDIVCCTAVY